MKILYGISSFLSLGTTVIPPLLGHNERDLPIYYQLYDGLYLLPEVSIFPLLRLLSSSDLTDVGDQQRV